MKWDIWIKSETICIEFSTISEEISKEAKKMEMINYSKFNSNLNSMELLKVFTPHHST